MPRVQLLDVSGPLDVFAEADVQARKDAYRLLIVAKTAGHIRSSSGVRLVPDLVIGDATEVKIDTLLVAECPNAADVRPDVAVVEWLRRAFSRQVGVTPALGVCID
jgi:transcriptional regulator GlxA family with amidase domain